MLNSLRMIKLLTTGSLLAVAFGQTVPPAAAPKPAAAKAAPTKPAASTPSQVDSVIELVKAGLSEGLIIKNLQRQNKPTELTVSDLLKLKNAGVSETLIGVMLDPASAPAPASGPAAPATAAAPAPAPVAPATTAASTPSPATIPIANPGPAAASGDAPLPPTSLGPAERKDAADVPLAKTAAKDWKDALKENINSTWKETHVGIDRIRITEVGTVFVLQKDGIVGDLSTDATFTKNTIEGGQIHGAKGVVAVLQNKKTNHVFKAGDKAYLWKVAMDGDELVLYLLSYDTYSANEKGGRSTQTRYKMMLDFKFAKDYVPTAPWSQLKTQILQFMLPEDEAKSANTKTISLGQSTAEVENSLGKPERIVNLGSKVTYIYKDMKVVFVEGKVADVQ